METRVTKKEKQQYFVGIISEVHNSFPNVIGLIWLQAPPLPPPPN